MFSQNLQIDDGMLLESFSCEITESHVIFKNHDLKIANTGLQLAQNNVYLNAQQFKLGKILGKGNGGYVQYAVFIENNKEVAIKTVNVHMKEKRRQLMNDLLLFLKSGYERKNLIVFYGAFFHEVHFIIIQGKYQKLMDMGSLRDIFILCKKQKNQKFEQLINENILSQITYQILKGIQYLHNNCNQVHRDIKLENILINSQGQVKLSDFGISKELNKNNQVCNTFIGTMTYMLFIYKNRSPERIQGLKYSYPSDIWSLGMLLIELSTGQYPYSLKQTYIEFLQTIIIEEEPNLPNNGVFSDEFRDFIQKWFIYLFISLKKDPNQRYTVDQLINHKWILLYQDRIVDQIQWIQELKDFQQNLKQQ